MGHRTLFLVLVALTSAIFGCSGYSDAPSAAADDSVISDDVGFSDFPFGDPGEWGVAGSPTGYKPQSKIWFNDGSWWGSLYDRSAGAYHIYRYGWHTRTWVDTGTLIDERDRSKADILWDGTHLYVASAASSATSDFASARLTRYSYNPTSRSYSLDDGFPVTIVDGGMEAIVLAKDTTGKLWVTYTRDERVYVNHSLDDDSTWGEPFVLPAQGAAVAADDISSVVAYNSHIGVMWSNQRDDTFYFATHKDGEAGDFWESSIAVRNPNIADDHVNLKAGPGGKVYAVVKTSLDEVEDRDPAAPLILLLVRARDGGWDSHTVSRVREKQTRPIVQIDEENRGLYVFATSPCCHGGAIYYKRTNLDDVSFPEGKGTPFIRSTTDTHVNDASSTKQNVNGTTRLLVLASDVTSGFYLHNVIDLGAAGTTP